MKAGQAEGAPEGAGTAHAAGNASFRADYHALTEGELSLYSPYHTNRFPRLGGRELNKKTSHPLQPDGVDRHPVSSAWGFSTTPGTLHGFISIR